MANTDNNAAVTLAGLQAMKQRGEKIACLTCYDATFTKVIEAAGVDMFIIGDSLGMVLMGYDTTLPVTMNDMLHHAANVARVGRHAYRVVDMPYQSYETPSQALDNARRLMDEGRADMIKLEGGSEVAAIVAHLVDHQIPVCGHIGLLPQSIEKLGGYKVQGRDAAGAALIRADAAAIEGAGGNRAWWQNAWHATCVPGLRGNGFRDRRSGATGRLQGLPSRQHNQ